MPGLFDEGRGTVPVSLYQKLTSRLSLLASLKACGHTFCRGCLDCWFSARHAEHLSAHPEYVPLSRNHRRAMNNPRVYPSAFLKAVAHLTQYPSPDYPCPVCRTSVTQIPIKNYSLRAITLILSDGDESERTGSVSADDSDSVGDWGVYFVN